MMSTRRGRGEDRTHLVGRQIDVDVLVLVDRVRIRRAVLTSPLEVLAIRQAGVDVVVTERDGAQPLEIKVEC
jgi:hypothetical protein